NPEIGTVQAKLVAADWGYGLALLELPRGMRAGSAASLATSSPRAHGRVITAGYPWQSSRPVVSEGGRILTNESERHWIAQIGSPMEIVGAQGEYGMSGGAVFSSNGEQVVGMLSHQYLRMVVGAPTRVSSFDGADAGVQNHVIAIPAEALRAWVSRVLRT